MTVSLDELLQKSAALHDHLCPKQVLGVRMGTLGGELLGLDLPRSDKRLLVIVETDGCFADGVTTVTGCSIGHRTLRVADYGKVVVTFVDTVSGAAVRIRPHPAARSAAGQFAPDASNRWESYLYGYQRMPVDRLFIWDSVRLVQSVREILSHPNALAVCTVCGEEIINEREVVRDGRVLCRACAGDRYYVVANSSPEMQLTSLRALI